MKATLKNYNQSPRKVREVVQSIQDKSVSVALGTLSGLCHKSAEALHKLIRSAVASAEQKGVTNVPSTHRVHIVVDKGIVIRRMFLLARGRANPYKRTRSHITVSLLPIKSI